MQRRRLFHSLPTEIESYKKVSKGVENVNKYQTYECDKTVDKIVVQSELCRDHKISEIDVSSVVQKIGLLAVGVFVTAPVFTWKSTRRIG